jgi:hypothetical protein
MDINLFRKSLASKQKLLNEDTPQERRAKAALNNTNKFLDKAEEALLYASDNLTEYLEASHGLLSPEEKRDMVNAAKELNALLAQLQKTGKKVPIA